MQNLGQFLKEYSGIHKNRIAYEIKRGFRTQRFTFEEVHDLVLKTSAFLAHNGVKKDDKVAIWSSNMPEYAIFFFACWNIGAIAVPIDIRTTDETLKIFLTKASCKVGFKGKFIPGTFGKLLKQSFYLEDLTELVKNFPLLSAPSNINTNHLAEIAFTSGTTGTPKGVVLTHANFLSNIDALTEAFPFKSQYKALSLLPLSHVFEQLVDFLVPFKTGIKVTYLERINRITLAKALRKNKITSVALVPQALQLLMRGIEAEVEKENKQKTWKMLNSISENLPFWARRIIFKPVLDKIGPSLLFFGCGSAPLNLKLVKKWENLGVSIFEGYGATETTAVLTINTPFQKKLGSVGKPLPGVSIKIDDKSQEILAKGPNISSGYFQDKEKTNSAFVDGWYHTGDVGKIDNDGFVYITGRVAFRIVLPNGQKVYPEDIEKKLNAHPLVIESCIVGVKNEEGETVHAVIITKFPNKLSKIIKDTNQKLASHEQILEYSLWQGEDFPRTPILKIDRKKVTQVTLSNPEFVQGKSKDPLTKGIQPQDKLINLISQVAKLPTTKIKETSTLATDLKLDSLQRVEILSLIEQEYIVAISETKINPQTTVGDLRKLIKVAPSSAEEIPISELIYSPKAAKLRTFLQNCFTFPIHSIFVPMSIEGKENLKNINLPAIFYFNHIGVMDGACVLRSLPSKIREKLVIAVNSDIWLDYRENFVQLLGGGFPFDKKKRIKASLELTGEFLDKGYSILLAPEGTFSKDGNLLKFKEGIGFMTVEMQVPVIPIKIDPAYREIFPPIGGFWENIPKKRQKVWVKIGKPLTFSKTISYKEATEKIQQALEEL